MEPNPAETGFQSKWHALLVTARFDRPIGTLLLLWPTLWALWLAAGGIPKIDVLIIFVLGVVIMRAAGCIINDLVDRDLDPQVERTRGRPIATGAINPTEAVIAIVVLLVIALGLVLLTNRLTIYLAFGGAGLALIYPFMKRLTYLPQLVLGAAFGWSIPMAWAAQTDSLSTIAWLLFAANVLWTTAYDTLYAMVDREDDIRAGVKSTAILFGELDLPFVAILQLSALAALVFVGQRMSLSWVYYAGVFGAACWFFYQHWLAGQRTRERYFKAFLNNNWVGLTVFVGIAGHYWLHGAAG